MLLLNMAFIQQKLSLKPIAVYGELNHELILQDVRLMSALPVTSFKPDNLYVLEWRNRPADGQELPQYLLCIGGGEEAAQYFGSRGVTCMVFPPETDIACLMSETQDIFQVSHNLHTEYHLLLMTKRPMRTILDFCTSFMENYAFLLDSKYNVLDVSTDDDTEKTGRLAGTKNGMADCVNRIADLLRNKEPTKDTPVGLLIEHVEESRNLPEFYYSRFFDGNQNIATLVVCQSYNPFYPYSAAMMQYLANLLQPCLIGRYSAGMKTHSYIRKAITAMIDDKGYNGESLAKNLAAIGWKMDDTYQLVFIRATVVNRMNSYASTDYYRYEDLFDDCIAINNPEYAVIVIHNASEEILARSMNSLRDLMTKNRTECRISLPFNDFMQIKPHYDIVRSSLFGLGEQRENVTMYRDVMAKHIISEVSTAFPVEALCHHAAVQLHEYDIENSTDLLITLEKYLSKNRSIQKASEELFIHRNTINYRIKKIEEITGLTLTSASTQDYLHLLLSCIVLRVLN